MKFWKLLVLGSTLVLTLLLGCEQKPAEQAATPAAAATAAPAVAAAYICPMGCEGSASDKPGKCPVCGMELEANPASKAPATDSL